MREFSHGLLASRPVPVRFETYTCFAVLSEVRGRQTARGHGQYCGTLVAVLRTRNKESCALLSGRRFDDSYKENVKNQVSAKLSKIAICTPSLQYFEEFVNSPVGGLYDFLHPALVALIQQSVCFVDDEVPQVLQREPRGLREMVQQSSGCCHNNIHLIVTIPVFEGMG